MKWLSLHKIILQVIKFAEKVSFQFPLKCVRVSNSAQVQQQIVPRLGGRQAEGALSKLQACPWDLQIQIRGWPQTMWWSGSAETDWRRFDMYNGTLPVLFMAKWTNKHSSYWIRASIGNQCSSMAAAVKWSCERSPYTSLTAALMMRCSGAIVVYGSPVSRELP